MCQRVREYICICVMGVICRVCAQTCKNVGAVCCVYVCVLLLWVMYGYYRVTVYKCSLTRVYGRVHVCVTCMYLWLLWRCVPVCVCRHHCIRV